MNEPCVYTNFNLHQLLKVSTPYEVQFALLNKLAESRAFLLRTGSRVYIKKPRVELARGFVRGYGFVKPVLYFRVIV